MRIKETGFTLIELLAVIVILAIIATIAIVNIVNVVENAKINALKTSAINVIDTAKKTYAIKQLAGTIGEEARVYYQDGQETEDSELSLEFSGEKPEYGKVLINNYGETEIVFYDGTYCAYKAISDKQVYVEKINQADCEDKAVLDYTDESYFAITEAGEITGLTTNLPSDVENLVIPKEIDDIKVKSIGMNAFSQYTDDMQIKTYRIDNIKKVIIPSGVINLGWYCFSSNQITSVIIPRTVTNIEEGAFDGNNLKSLVIPDSVLTIGVTAFISNELEEITIGNRVTTISDGAFANNQLKNVVIPDSVENIYGDAFLNNLLEKVTIGKGITYIGSTAFANNKIPQGSLIIKRSSGSVTIDEDEYSGSFTNNGPNSNIKITPIYQP